MDGKRFGFLPTLYGTDLSVKVSRNLLPGIEAVISRLGGRLGLCRFSCSLHSGNALGGKHLVGFYPRFMNCGNCKGNAVGRWRNLTTCPRGALRRLTRIVSSTTLGFVSNETN